MKSKVDKVMDDKIEVVSLDSSLDNAINSIVNEGKKIIVEMDATKTKYAYLEPNYVNPDDLSKDKQVKDVHLVNAKQVSSDTPIDSIKDCIREAIPVVVKSNEPGKDEVEGIITVSEMVKPKDESKKTINGDEKQSQ